MKHTLIVMLLPLFLSSCASTGFLMAKARVSLYREAYPAKDKNAQIDIYRTLRPEQEYIEIGEISCRDTNNDWALKQTLIKAREIGADGIIILGQAGTSSVGVPVGDLTVYSDAGGYGVRAVAIKYTR
jgi:hypothetical protein